MRVESIQMFRDILREDGWTRRGKYTYVSPDGQNSISVGQYDMNDTFVVEFMIEDLIAAGATDLARRLGARI